MDFHTARGNGELTPIKPDENSVSIETNVGRIRLYGANIVAGATLVSVIVIGVFVYEHRVDAKLGTGELTAAIREMTASQREMNCLISMPQDKREAAYMAENSLCKRLARDR